jgi:hypothetical protein
VSASHATLLSLPKGIMSVNTEREVADYLAEVMDENWDADDVDLVEWARDLLIELSMEGLCSKPFGLDDWDELIDDDTRMKTLGKLLADLLSSVYGRSVSAG